ncbi:spermidine synthase [Halogeometricum limi]|uniref:Spermidine synthase n=1 Tax=Halogeometricum limi TaxID=555875 RepID=A0A1I6IN50_9EURY|nr:spermidine synthase [Halogeometricum limi]SFR67710.1 spermidine synthase [Halogeometricum limi]
MTRPSRTKTLALLCVTFVVSFCSFAYEFVYSELLTVMYGGTVTQYVVTIGLYFFSLGVGAALSDDLAGDRPSNFFRTEVYLAVVAPAGFLLVVALNSVRLPQFVPAELVWVVARSPVVAVGFLSGFELPLLTRMVEDEEGDTSELLPAWASNAVDAVHDAVVRLLGVFWHVERSAGERSGLSLVLAMDYVGGLVGAVVYARVLYPRLGLVPTIFVLAFLNGVAALAFLARFSGRWGLFRGERRTLVGRESAALVAACLLVTAACGAAVVEHERVDRSVSAAYLEQDVENDYAPGAMAVTVVGQQTTTYQHVVEYERRWTGSGPNPYFEGETDRCLRLGTAVQLCDSWADTYHSGLVDVPMTRFAHSPETDVLLVGGGDYVAVDHLREYGVDVDHVDIDAEFMAYARNDSFLSSWHDDAHAYDRLNTTAGDGYAYVQETNETYDVVLLDVPGATDDDLLKLYSTEFYGAVRDRLEPDGVVVTWAYDGNAYGDHAKAFSNTVRDAGFTRYAPYWGWEDIDADGDVERVERFYVLAPDRAENTTGAAFDVTRGDDYVRKYGDRYRDVRWRELPRYNGVEVNSIFDPNYDIIVDRQ